MIVFRVETPKGLGAYKAQVGIDSFIADHRPMPYDDGLDRKLKTHRFGFKSLTDFRKWFKEKSNVLMLHEHGLQLSVYRVKGKKTVRLGGKQLTFSKRYAKLIARVPLNTL